MQIVRFNSTICMEKFAGLSYDAIPKMANMIYLIVDQSRLSD